jgi:hypothetical protein
LVQRAGLDARDRGRGFLKVVRPGRVAGVAAAHRAVHAVAVPAVLAEDERAGVLAAIDLANLVAHFGLRALQAGADVATAAAQREAPLAGYRASFRPCWAAVAAVLADDRRRAA